MRLRASNCFIVFLMSALGLTLAFGQRSAPLIDAPRFWNDKDLDDWATPIAALNVRPAHYSEREYYAAPVAEWLRTYPVYAPGREPAGYWQMLKGKKPEALVTSGPRSAAEWIAVGRRVFDEMDFPGARVYNARQIAVFRDRATYLKAGGSFEFSDGRIPSARWVPTSKGLALSVNDCSGCHTRIMPDGAAVAGAPASDLGNAALAKVYEQVILPPPPSDESRAMTTWRQFEVPWMSPDVHRRLKTMSAAELADLDDPSGAVYRFNGSPFYPTKIPDLIGLRDRKYIDHTATHRLRGVEHVMRYAALISCCDIADFGPYRIWTDRQRHISGRFPDEVLFALAQYLFSLQPPPNPNANDPRAAAGQQVFERERCPACHTPPLYTNNKLTLAKGFTPAADHPLRADILPISIGTDPNAALNTRKGTGLYKVPSLRGVWYRSLLGHDAGVKTLEEWLDPARLREEYVPSGFKGFKGTHRAIHGHEFGLRLSAGDKAALIAFLRTL